MITTRINKMIRSFETFGRSYCFLYRLLGFFPIRYKYYKVAFIHHSASLIMANGKKLNNERLEFLGDSVLSAVVCGYLYDKYPMWNEGKMSKRKSMLVRREVVNAVAEQMGVYDHIQKRNDDSVFYKDISGNTLEAIIGAVYLDRGYGKAKYFVTKKVIPMFESIERDILDFTINYKSILFEWVQKHHLNICFEIVNEPKDIRDEFVCNILIDGDFICQGKGRTKKESHQNASHMAIVKLSETHKDIFIP